MHRTIVNKFTKMIATVGPASFSPKVIESFIRSGVNVVRLNTSHGTLEEHAKIIEDVRRISKKNNIETGIILDLPGPKVRLGALPQALLLTKAHQVALVWGHGRASVPKSVVLPVPTIISKVLRKDAVVAIDDGKILLKVKSVKKDYALASVAAGGEVTSHKGIAVLGEDIPMDSLTAKDLSALKLAPLVDYVAVSFIRKAGDVEKVKKKLSRLVKSKAKMPQIVAKLETRGALENLDEIIQASDVIMVARGDLALAIDPAELGVVQKGIVLRARQAGKPVAIATQMLDSMTLRPIPTRAEILDVTNAVMDHADAVMLSGESASGQYPQEAVKFMARTAKFSEDSDYNNLPLEPLEIEANQKHVFAHFLSTFVETHKIKYILNEDADAELAALISRHRVEAYQIIPVGDGFEARKYALMWGVMPVVNKNKPLAGLPKGRLVLVAGWHKEGGKKTGYIRIERS